MPILQLSTYGFRWQTAYWWFLLIKYLLFYTNFRLVKWKKRKRVRKSAVLSQKNYCFFPPHIYWLCVLAFILTPAIVFSRISKLIELLCCTMDSIDFRWATTHCYLMDYTIKYSICFWRCNFFVLAFYWNNAHFKSGKWSQKAFSFSFWSTLDYFRPKINWYKFAICFIPFMLTIYCGSSEFPNIVIIWKTPRMESLNG